MVILFRKLKDNLIYFFNSRILVFALLMLVLCGILVARLYRLQIIHGDEYLSNFNIKIKKEQVIPNTRGQIYDCKGRVLAYNELVYSVVIEDNGTYEDLEEKNKILNSQLLELFQIIESNGDSVIRDFDVSIDENGQYVYMSDGNERLRFLADIFGRIYIDDLEEEERNMSANDLVAYLCGENVYDIDTAALSTDQILKLLSIRTGLSFNSYQKYITTTIAENISDATKAAILENEEKYTGVSIKESTIRKYNYSPYMSQILGYVGAISSEELNNYKGIDEKYDESYVVGKTGIERYMESDLQGTNGFTSFFVDNLGKVIEVDEETKPTAGNDVYLSVDADQQETIYHILEQHLAGILLSRLVRTSGYETRKITETDDLVISIDDVYIQLIKNNLINTGHFQAADASNNERQVYQTWKSKFDAVTGSICGELTAGTSKPVIEYNEEFQDYQYEILNHIVDKGVIKEDAATENYTPYQELSRGSISLREYISTCIADKLIDTDLILADNAYADAQELYTSLTDYIRKEMEHDRTYEKLLYEYLILDKQISGRELCLILYDQNILTMDISRYDGLASGKSSPFDFIYEKIANLELTPAQLALDPCSAAVVLTDVNTGKVRALVSYPSYDNNRLTNHIDSAYYNQLINDAALPLYNRATQQKTAPGSTFKMVSAVAGLEEGVITPDTMIEDLGEFTKVESNNKCWIYPLNHGYLNVTSAIRHSCNYFFYEVGYRLGLTGSDESSFNDSFGISRLDKYASQFGLDEVSGVEIAESEPQLATQYPITAAIGQSNHNYTSSQLARYVSTIANGGNLYQLSLIDSVKNTEGEVLKQIEPKLTRKLDFSSSSMSVIRTGMRNMAESSSVLSGMQVQVSGKTGTAQEVANRGDHALFVGYAPSEAPQVGISVRIPNGYVSSNAVEIARDVLNYYFNFTNKEEIMTGRAITPGTEVIHD